MGSGNMSCMGQGGTSASPCSGYRTFGFKETKGRDSERPVYIFLQYYELKVIAQVSYGNIQLGSEARHAS